MRSFLNLARKYQALSIFVIGLVLNLALLWPLLAAPYFTHHDDVQTIRLLEMHKCFIDSQFPCRWVPDLGGLYGYPLFNYYGPLPYYAGEMFFLITESLLISAKLMFATAFIGSYIFMFLLSRRVWGSWGGIVSGTFYSYAPYHAVDFYIRGAMGELWALMFFPAVLWGFFRLLDRTNLKNVLLLGLFIGLLIMSHNLATMIFLPFVILLAVIIVFTQRKWLFLIRFILALLIGLLLSAFYWLPALAEKSLVHVDSTISGYFSYTEHFKGLKKLFIDRNWEYGSSIREYPGSEKDGLPYQIGWVHLFGWILALVAAKMFWVKRRSLSLLIIFSSLAILISVFMIHPKSEFVWKLLDPLKYLQFPWRFLMLVTFFISFIAGAVTLIFNKYQRLVVIVLIGLVVLLNFSYFRPNLFIFEDDQYLLSGPKWRESIKRSIYDYLPIYAKAPPAELADRRYKVISGDSEVLNIKEGSDWMTFKANTKALTFLQVSQYYFPDFQVKVDGHQVNINYHNDLGLISFYLDPGFHNVDIRLHNTWVRVIANWITILGIFLSISILVLQIKKIRSYVFYLAKGWYK